MKKYIALLLVVILLCTTALFLSVSAADTPESSLTWTYDKSTQTLTISGSGPMIYTGSNEWSPKSRSTTKVIIDEGITSVCTRAFQYFENLTSVTLPKSVTHIDSFAFDGCISLTDINLQHVTSIDNYAFRKCQALTTLTDLDALTTIGNNAFDFCTSLHTVTFGNKLKSIGQDAFYRCTALTSLTISNSVTTIGNYAFSNCEKLTQLTLEPGLTTLGVGMFRGCFRLTSVKIPDSITEIPNGIFQECEELEEVTIGTGVTKIGAGAFSSCIRLTDIHFLGNPPQLNDTAFNYVTATAYYPGGIAEWKTVSVPKGDITWKPVFCESHTAIPIPGTTPTCNQEGLSEGSICSICRQIITAQQSVPKTAHTYGAWVTDDAPTPTKKRTCSTCGYEQIDTSTHLEPTTPDPTVSQAPTESTPVENATENSTPITDDPAAATDPIDIPKDTDGSKNALLFVGIGIVLLGLATSGIFFLKPGFGRKK